MGILARTDVIITTKDAEQAGKVKDLLAGFALEYITVKDNAVLFGLFSNRIQEIEDKLEEVWFEVKDEADEMNCPVLTETNGYYYSNKT